VPWYRFGDFTGDAMPAYPKLDFRHPAIAVLGIRGMGQLLYISGFEPAFVAWVEPAVPQVASGNLKGVA
jgi:hypothetical protein